MGINFIPIFSVKCADKPVYALVLLDNNVRVEISRGNFASQTRVHARPIHSEQQIRFVLLPKLQDFAETGVFSTFGMTWKVVVAAEVLSIPKKALGAVLQNAQVQLESTTLLAATIVLVALSCVFEKLLHKGFLCLFSVISLHLPYITLFFH